MALWTDTRNTGIVFHFYDGKTLKAELGREGCLCVIGVEGKEAQRATCSAAARSALITVT